MSEGHLAPGLGDLCPALYTLLTPVLVGGRRKSLSLELLFTNGVSPENVLGEASPLALTKGAMCQARVPSDRTEAKTTPPSPSWPLSLQPPVMFIGLDISHDSCLSKMHLAQSQTPVDAAAPPGTQAAPLPLPARAVFLTRDLYQADHPELRAVLGTSLAPGNSEGMSLFSTISGQQGEMTGTL